MTKPCEKHAPNLKVGLKFTQTCSFRKYTSQYQEHLNLADVSIFFFKKLAFLGKNSTFTQSNSAKAA